MAITFTTGETFPAGASVVTATKLNNTVNVMTMTMATGKVLGRATAGTGAVEELSTTGSGNVVLSTSPTLVTPALGTPASGVVTNLTGTASININGTVGATTPATGAFTTLSATGAVSFGDVVAGGATFGDTVMSTGGGIQTVMSYGGGYATFGSNSAHDVRILRNGGVVAVVEATGLAVTGTLSATGVVTIAKATGGQAITNVSGNTTGVYQSYVTSAGIKGYVGTGDQLVSGGAVNDIGLDSVLGNIILATADVTRVTISSTGLAVTGTLSASGVVTLADTTDASSSTTGALKTAGGLGVAKKLYVGTEAEIGSASSNGFLTVTGSSLLGAVSIWAGSSGGSGRIQMLNASSAASIVMWGDGDSGGGSIDIGSGLIQAGCVQLGASTTTRASFQILHGTAPTSPSNGDIWTTTAGLYVRINGVTRLVTVT